MKVRLWPYKLGSEGCRNLQAALQAQGVDCLRVRTDGRYKPRLNHLIINWGNSRAEGSARNWLIDFGDRRIVLNHPINVNLASNKLETFNQLSFEDVSVPPWSIVKTRAEDWVIEGKRVYCRTKLTGRSGAGIVVASTVDELVDAPLYTVGIDVKGEYRVHVFRNTPQGGAFRNLNNELKVIDITKKRLRTEARDSGECNRLVRNLDGGWVFCHNNIDLSEEAQQEAIKAVGALGLDFGAVDLVIEKNTGKAYVLEVNTAPGLSSETTLNAYVSAIKELMQ